ncbi:putative ABC transporter permease [Fusobacterium sp.]|uniref:putative ABC transporter permease n=1 Tax=Fusobacterium sp. TaxID=68766 RepID=UPI0029010C87|nr:putative ABC transporter permease [Fusobacterium sp.]MDU1912122.1 putative ABC transporter permease [Fusobacterium sp.]
MYRYLFYFLIYSFLGWCVEVCYATLNTRKFINRGFLNGPYCPIYGVGIMCIIYFVFPLKNNMFILFIASVILTSVLEFLTGFILEKIFHYRWWDYSNVPFNICGYICLKFSILWGIACVLVVDIIHPVVEGIISWLPLLVGKIILTVAGTFILIDFLVTVKTVLKLNAKLEKLERIAGDIHRFSDKIGGKVSSDFMAAQDKIEELKRKREELLKNIPWLEKRIMKSFPDMKSTKYNEDTFTAIKDVDKK